MPTIGGNISVGYETACPTAATTSVAPRLLRLPSDTLPLSARADVLVFQTAPLDADLEVTGPLEVQLWASSSAVDTDFTAKLIDVYPPNARLPRRLRAEPRATASSAPATARTARGPSSSRRARSYEFDDRALPDQQPASRSGHRIRLDISVSNFPRFDVNPNTGEPLGRHRRFELAHQTIYHDAAHPSHIILPIIPAG